MTPLRGTVCDMLKAFSDYTYRDLARKRPMAEQVEKIVSNHPDLATRRSWAMTTPHHSELVKRAFQQETDSVVLGSLLQQYDPSPEDLPRVAQHAEPFDVLRFTFQSASLPDQVAQEAFLKAYHQTPGKTLDAAREAVRDFREGGGKIFASKDATVAALVTHQRLPNLGKVLTFVQGPLSRRAVLQRLKSLQSNPEHVIQHQLVQVTKGLPWTSAERIQWEKTIHKLLDAELGEKATDTLVKPTNKKDKTREERADEALLLKARNEASINLILQRTQEGEWDEALTLLQETKDKALRCQAADRLLRSEVPVKHLPGLMRLGTIDGATYVIDRLTSVTLTQEEARNISNAAQFTGVRDTSLGRYLRKHIHHFTFTSLSDVRNLFAGATAKETSHVLAHLVQTGEFGRLEGNLTNYATTLEHLEYFTLETIARSSQSSQFLTLLLTELSTEELEILDTISPKTPLGKARQAARDILR